jgi:hypothetical protein
MPSLKTSAVLAFSGIALFASPVMAEEAPKAEITKTEVQNEQVMAAVQSADLIPVQDAEGNIFYNHYVSDDELQDAGVDIEVVDTFTFEHNGRIYTNKIVSE